MTSGAPERRLAAGGFSDWLHDIEAALVGVRDVDVPCGDCTACCRSSQFVHIGPEETDALQHIPGELLFPAPRMPAGHMVMGYDDQGRCPMLGEQGCSIYEHRPRTCRVYDCRIFAAAGVDVDEDKPLILERARRWSFDYPTDDDSARHQAVLAAADGLRGCAERLPSHLIPGTSTQLAVLAVEVHAEFVDSDTDDVDLVTLLEQRHARRRPA